MASRCGHWRTKKNEKLQCEVALKLARAVRDIVTDLRVAAALTHIFAATCKQELPAFGDITRAILLRGGHRPARANNWLASHRVDRSRWWPRVSLPGCSNVTRLGAAEDGGKSVCRAADMLGMRPCHVVSVGSNGDATFENAVHNFAPHCRVSTWDGTLVGKRARLASRLPTWLTFLPMNWNASSWMHYRKEGTDVVSLLKVDCEGCEATELAPWLEHVCAEQIVLELHAYPSKEYVELLAW